MGYVHKEIANPFYYSPERWRDTLYSKTTALLLHALTVSLPIQYNTIPSWFTMLSFIGEIQWKNSRVNPIPWVRTPRQGERVYNTPGLQTQLNNISASGRLGSTTNNLPLGDWSQQLHRCCTCWTMLWTLDLTKFSSSSSRLKVN